MAWLLPELDEGAEPELKPPELELEEDPEPEFDDDEPELAPELAVDPELELEPEVGFAPELELVPDEPVLEGLAPEEPVPVEPVPVEPVPVEPEEVLAVWVDPGRLKATAPATTTLAMPTAVVVERTRARPRARAATAWRIPSPRSLLTPLSLRCGTRGSLNGSSRLALKIERLVRALVQRG